MGLLPGTDMIRLHQKEHWTKPPPGMTPSYSLSTCSIRGFYVPMFKFPKCLTPLSSHLCRWGSTNKQPRWNLEIHSRDSISSVPYKSTLDYHTNPIAVDTFCRFTTRLSFYNFVGKIFSVFLLEPLYGILGTNTVKCLPWRDVCLPGG